LEAGKVGPGGCTRNGKDEGLENRQRRRFVSKEEFETGTGIDHLKTVRLERLGMNRASDSGPLELPENTCQMILVTADNWEDCRARLALYEKRAGKWEKYEDFPAVCGEKGMAWGRGLIPARPGETFTPIKREGDQKTPAGIFRLGECLGYAPQLVVNPELPYRQIVESMQGVDDPASRYYNQIVNTAAIDRAEIDWKSYEIMRRTDERYKWLMVIGHNPENLPGWGSLIFLHIWRDQATGTAGCTAVSEATILTVFKWLKPALNPVIVQCPREVCEDRKYQLLQNEAE
jgi:L,D-peptidoglycan transpeptidase YkuD (ErfK/YbiS/YcfS/YnhG family)